MKPLTASKITTTKLMMTSAICTLFLILILIVKQFQDVEQLIVTGAMFILALNSLLISLQIRNRFLSIGSFIIILISVIELLIILFHIQMFIGHSLYLLKFIYIVGIAVCLRGLHVSVLHQKEQNKLIQKHNDQLRLFSTSSKMIYFDYYPEYDYANLYLSDGFVKAYNLTYNSLKLSTEDYFSYIHKEDQSKLMSALKNIMIDSNIQMEKRLKLPEMNDYCWVFANTQLDYKNKIIGVDYDITSVKQNEEHLMNKNNTLRLKETEQNYILDNSSDLIIRLSTKGDILYCSKSYAAILNQERDALMGKNIIEVSESLGVKDTKWLLDTQKPPYVTMHIATVFIKHEKRTISWRNDAVLNHDQEVEFIVSIGHDITKIINLNEQLTIESSHDYLTGLLNRRGLFKKLDRLKHHQQVAAFFFDIDNFKTINDYYGHDIGDQVLIHFAKQLLKLKSPDSIVARLSGDEFLLVHIGNDCNTLEPIKNRLCEQIQDTYTVRNINIYLQITMGYAIHPEDTRGDINKLINYADLGMYEAKRSGNKNCLRFDSNMLKELKQKVVMANEIKTAIEHDAFDVFFQPIINTTHNKTDYLESLVRWNHPKQGFISPDTFLSIAKNSGLIVQMDLYLINKSFIYFKQLKNKSDYKQVMLTINVAPMTFLKDHFPTTLDELITKHNINPKSICVEISENTFVNNLQLCNKQLRSLKRYGVMIALDDFGRQYSSLAILDRVDFDIIKIDQLFTNQIHTQKNKEIVNMIINVANLMGKIVIAEGVETEQQKEILSTLGCNLQQGYYFQKPSKLI